MRAVGWCIALVLFLAGGLADRALAAEPPVAFGSYRALVIGNNDYKHIPKLKTAETDAKAVAVVLRERYGFKVELMLNATRYDIVTAFGRLRAETEPSDNVLVYYAGHGHLGRETESGYWLPVDAEPDNEAHWLANESITRGLKAMPAKHVMVIADSCYSGTLVRAAPVGLKTGAERIAWLRRMAEKRARTALVSGGLEPVMDGGGGGHSVFAKAFLDTLRGNTEVLDGHALFTELSRKVVVNAEQTPQYSDVRNAGHEGGEFLFVPLGVNLVAGAEGTAGAGPAAGQPRSGAEELFWQSVNASDKAADYEAYLQSFPNGVFAPLARARLRQLSERKPAEPPRTAALSAAPAATTPPPAAKAEKLDLEPIDAMYVARRAGNIRAGPSVQAERLGGLTPGSRILVLGRLRGQPWYLVEYRGQGTAYVQVDLLAPWQEETAQGTSPSGQGQQARLEPPAPAPESAARSVPPARLVYNVQPVGYVPAR